MNAPQKMSPAAPMPVTVTRQGVEYRIREWSKDIVLDALDRFPQFLVAKDDVVEYDLKMYAAAEEDDRECLNAVMEAAGLLTRTEQGSYGIYPVGNDDRYYHGPWFQGERLYFPAEELELARDFLKAISGTDIHERPHVDLEIRLCVQSAKFEIVPSIAA